MRRPTIIYSNCSAKLRNIIGLKICTDNDYHFIATAHHLDDQAETFLINFTRGTGIDGLVGIPEKMKILYGRCYFRGMKLFRMPKHQINWREDASNAGTKYLRNKLRHLVVPLLKKENDQFLKSFQNTITYLQETQFLAQQSLANFETACVTVTNNQTIINLNCVYKFNGYVYYITHFLKRFGFFVATEIEKILQTHSGKMLKNDKFILLKTVVKLLFTKNILKKKQEYIINNVNDFAKLSLNLKVQEVLSIIGYSDKNTIFVDCNLLKYPLVLRKPETGDRFQPFGMKGMKKVSKFFKDEKIPQFQKQQTWILVNGDGK